MNVAVYNFLKVPVSHFCAVMSDVGSAILLFVVLSRKGQLMNMFMMASLIGSSCCWNRL